MAVFWVGLALPWDADNSRLHSNCSAFGGSGLIQARNLACHLELQGSGFTNTAN